MCVRSLWSESKNHLSLELVAAVGNRQRESLPPKATQFSMILGIAVIKSCGSSSFEGYLRLCSLTFLVPIHFHLHGKYGFFHLSA